MRVIAGSAKGRKLKSPNTDETRPILDRVKTALFDILSSADALVDARVLDLFAGAGQIGIEALSRGAALATFIELNPVVAQIVRENLELTRLSAHAEVIRGDAFVFLRTARAQRKFYDLIYIAPPQYKGMAAQALQILDREPLTEPSGLIITQTHPRERADFESLALTRLRRYDERVYGSTLLLFYEHMDVQAEEAAGDTNAGDVGHT
jgi:16S rRNA (guanine(966)-N(2))-methyltransferase RsmD